MMMSRKALSMLALVMVVGCGRGDTTAPIAPTLNGVRPEATAAEFPLASPRSGALEITKSCTDYTGAAGSFCTITASNLKQIPAGTRVVYASPLSAGVIDSDVMLDPPGDGASTAFGHCRLVLASGLGACTFSGGTGKFTWFNGSVVVRALGARQWAWSGTYSFDPRE
jgi:hypothetical protein